MSRPSTTLDMLISERLTRLVALFPIDGGVKAITRSVWIDSLKFLTPTQIAAGFDRLESGFIPTSACPFPVPAQLMAMVADARENKAQIDAEQAWDDLTKWMHYYYRPDCRDSKFPLMEARIMHSARAAGGLEHISSCPIKELAWAKKRFIEAYLSLGKLEEDKPLLASPEVMKQLGEVAQRKELK